VVLKLELEEADEEEDDDVDFKSGALKFAEVPKFGTG